MYAFDSVKYGLIDCFVCSFWKFLGVFFRIVFFTFSSEVLSDPIVLMICCVWKKNRWEVG